MLFRSLVSEPTLRRGMGAAAREESAKYDIERTARIMLGHYERIVQAAAQRRKDQPNRTRTILEQFNF